MRPDNLKTKIFLDGSDLEETKKLQSLLGFLDGQTTNPSNFAKSPQTAALVAQGRKFDRDEVYAAYKKRVQSLSQLMPDGAISVEVYADAQTTADQMITQAKEMFGWIDNAHIKLPITSEGLKAAKQLISDGLRLNLTLCFNQEQAAAVYAATKGAKAGDVFVSPFVGRLVDRGQEGMDLIKNILKMFAAGDGHVLVLTSSVRNLEQFTRALALGTDLITAYYAAINEWGKAGLPIPDLSTFGPSQLEEIPYQDISLEKNWQDYNISHELTGIGLQKFADDWNALINNKSR